MTSRPIWMPFYPRDYLADTQHLNTLQHGAYVLLILEYWCKGKLPSTDAELVKVTRLSLKQWRANKPTLAAMFSSDWRHERIEWELKKANELRLKRQVFGSKGGRSTRVRHGSARSKFRAWPGQQ